VSAADRAHAWDDSYAGPAPPWDIGRPQPAFLRLAEGGSFVGRLLDAGCGTGEHTILAAGHGARVLGIDLSPRAIGVAAGKAAQRGVDARFEVLDARDLPALGETFDTIIDSGLFHVFDGADCASYVRALHEVLRPDGHLHLMCFSDRQPGDWGPRRVTEEELRRSFEVGWRVRSLTSDRFALNPGPGPLHAEAWLADIVRLPADREVPAGP
jgi:SAM-dependent methyltransferase